MAKICTSIEQSKKLIELGLNVNTADMYYNLGESNIPNVMYGDSKYFKCYQLAWSLSALLELMPQWTLNGFTNGKFNCRDDRAEKYSLVDTCPLDAAFEMVCWLLENKKI